jgi:dihydroflavonol-4-reductase
MAGMIALVTGSTGFIGSNLCRVLLERGYQVRAFHRPSSNTRLLDGLDVEHCLGDLTQPESLEQAVEGAEVVFHAAAWMGGNEQSGRLYAVTVEGTRSILQAARKAGVRRVVHTSSVAALGIPGAGNGRQPGGYPPSVNENHTWNIGPDVYPYGYAKYLAEKEVQKAVARGLDAVIVNPSLVFGAGDGYRQGSSIITQVAQRRVSVAVEGGVNCVHIADVIEGHIAALECGRTGERYILGGENLTLLQMLNLIAEVTGVPGPTLVLPGWLLRSLTLPALILRPFLNLPISPEMLRMAGNYFFYNTSKAESELGLNKPRSAKEAFTDAYNWFQQPRLNQ